MDGEYDVTQITDYEVRDALLYLTFADLFYYTKELYKISPNELVPLFDDSDDYMVIANIEKSNGSTTYTLIFCTRDLIDEMQPSTKFVFHPNEYKVDIDFADDLGNFGEKGGHEEIDDFQNETLYMYEGNEWDFEDLASHYMTRKALSAALVQWKIAKEKIVDQRNVPQAIRDIKCPLPKLRAPIEKSEES